MSESEQRRKLINSLVLETGADMRTVRRWLQGERVQRVSRYALEAAADKLGIRRPRPQSVVDDAAGAA